MLLESSPGKIQEVGVGLCCQEDLLHKPNKKLTNEIKDILKKNIEDSKIKIRKENRN